MEHLEQYLCTCYYISKLFELLNTTWQMAKCFECHDRKVLKLFSNLFFSINSLLT